MLSGILPGSCSGSLAGILIGIINYLWRLAEFRKCPRDLELAVEVGPPVPTEIRSARLRSGSAQ